MEVKKVAKGEAIIDESLCTGCSYCVVACKRGCVEISSEKVDARGLSKAVVAKPENCNACGNCAIVCPSFAIEVYALTAT